MLKREKAHSNADFRLRLLVFAHLLWLLTVCLLGAWWGRLLLKQAGRIVELEKALGWAADFTRTQWYRTQRMLYWESATFFALLLACTGFLIWVYWRDVKRARGLQAFFASVTHELRTPLTSIRLQAESIAENLSGDESQRDLVQRLLEDSIRLEAQVERTLELARVEGGGPVYTQPLQIKPWIDRFLKTWTVDYKERVQINTEVDDLVIEADPAAMQVIFRNLLENSVRHSKKDKVLITISTRPNPKDQKNVFILVKDDGQGLNPSFPNSRRKEESLGVLFQKGSSSQGTGVGLYLVKVLMKRMGGAVRFSSPSGSSEFEGFEVLLKFREGQIHV